MKKRWGFLLGLLLLLLTAGSSHSAASTDEIRGYREYGTAELKEVMQEILEWEKAQQGEQQVFGDAFLKSAGSSLCDWLAIGIGRSGYKEDYTSYRAAVIEKLERQEKEKNSNAASVTELQRMALTIAALGGDPSGVTASDRNLVKESVYGVKNVNVLQKNGLNGLIWGLLLADSCRYQIPEESAVNRRTMLHALLSAQKRDGSFSMEKKDKTGDVDITAMALQAMAPYYKSGRRISSKKIDKAVERGLNWLSGQQKESGGFASWDTENAESCAQVILALCSLNIDLQQSERFIKNNHTVLEALLTYQQEDGGFAHSFGMQNREEGEESSLSDGMATQQAYCALTAIVRYYEGSRRFYDFREEKKIQTSRIVFTKEDEQAAEGLPEQMTTRQKELTDYLYEKLETAKNRESYQQTWKILRRKKKEIDVLQKKLDNINDTILKHLYPFDRLSQTQKKILRSLEDDYNSLSEYDKNQILSRSAFEAALVRPERDRLNLFFSILFVLAGSISAAIAADFYRFTI